MNRAIGKNSQVLQILAREIQELISQEEIDMEGLQEIRLRVGSPVILNIRGKERIPKRNGKPHLVTKTEMRETVDYISSLFFYMLLKRSCDRDSDSGRRTSGRNGRKSDYGSGNDKEYPVYFIRQYPGGT